VRGIRQLPPAHVLTLHEGVERRRRYWRPWDALIDTHDATALPLEASDAMRLEVTNRSLAHAVATRVPAEVPFGVFLSGGIDSGLVAVLASRTWGRPFPTFSMRIDHRGYDESPLAAQVARSIRSEHHEVTMTARDGEEAFTSWAAGMDQPLGDPSVLPTWLLARHASRHVPVVLTGEGGDELFAGYPTYLGHRHATLAAALPGPLTSLTLALARRFRPRHHHVTVAHLLERFLGVRGLGAFERHLAWFGTARAHEARALLAPELRAGLAEDDALRHARTLERQLADVEIVRPGRAHPLAAYQLLDFETYLPGGLLTKVDRCTMAHGVESRAPFLQPGLIAHALRLPESLRLRGTSGKFALRQVAASLLPREILTRRKQGFSPPFSAWSRGPLRSVVEDTLSESRVRAAGVLDPATVGPLVQAHLAGHEDRGRTLWAVLMLQCWAERAAATRNAVVASV
jgi:asparagine synthase (glutamine-hydrolysing)